MSMATVNLTEGKLLSIDESVIFAELPEELKQEVIAEIVEHLRWASARYDHTDTPREWYSARLKR